MSATDVSNGQGDNDPQSGTPSRFRRLIRFAFGTRLRSAISALAVMCAGIVGFAAEWDDAVRSSLNPLRPVIGVPKPMPKFPPPLLKTSFGNWDTYEVHTFMKAHVDQTVRLEVTVESDLNDRQHLPSEGLTWMDVEEKNPDMRGPISLAAQIDSKTGHGPRSQILYTMEVLHISAVPVGHPKPYRLVNTVGTWEIRGTFHIDQQSAGMQQYITELTPTG